jgi:uncharacterized protein (DUF427 family)
MKAVLDGVVIAEADRDDLVRVEGNWYFPPASVREGVLVESPTPYTCPWKGAAQYFSIRADDAELTDGAWSYPNLYPTAAEKVGVDFAGYVAFDRRVLVED